MHLAYIMKHSPIGKRVELGGFNVGLEQCLWVIANGLGFPPKDDMETCHRNFYALFKG